MVVRTADGRADHPSNDPLMSLRGPVYANLHGPRIRGPERSHMTIQVYVEINVARILALGFALLVYLT
jgi:hypothetical protein